MKTQLLFVLDLERFRLTGRGLKFLPKQNCGYNTISRRAPNNLTSPKYPNFYDSRLYCYWYIEADNENDIIKFTVIDVDIDDGDEDFSRDVDELTFKSDVCDENGKIYSTDNSQIKLNNEVIAKNNISLPLTYYSSGPTAELSFRSDIAYAGRGFRLIYESVPNYNLSQTQNGTEKCPIKQSPTDYDFNYEYDYEVDHNITLDAGDFYGMYQQSKLSDYTDFRRAALLPRELVVINGHLESDFIVQCTYDGVSCNRRGKDFIGFEDPIYGKCFSFNSVR